MLDSEIEEIANNLATLIFSNDPSTEQLYYANNAGSITDESSGEIRLWRQLLIEGLSDYLQFINSPNHKRKFYSAFDWFFNEEDPSWLGSFTTVCYTLNLEPSYVRRILVKWTKEHYIPGARDIHIPKAPPIRYYIPLNNLLAKQFTRFNEAEGRYE